MIWILLLGFFALVFGLLFVFGPKALMRISTEMNKMVKNVDSQVMGHRVGVGVALVVVSLFLFYYGFTIGAR